METKSLITRIKTFVFEVYAEWRPWIFGGWLFITYAWTYTFVYDLPDTIRKEHQRIVAETVVFSEDPNIPIETIESPLAKRIEKDRDTLALIISAAFLLAILPKKTGVHR